VYAELLSPGAQPWPLLLDAGSARGTCAFVKTPHRHDVFVCRLYKRRVTELHSLRGFRAAIPNPKERSMTKISIKHGLEVVEGHPYGNLNGALRSWRATEEQSR